MNKSKRKWWLLLFSLPVLGAFLHQQNNALTISTYALPSSHLPLAFDGYRIVQISDLHNHTFGQKQEPLVEKVQEAKPDLIVITGDLVDARRYDEKPSLLLVNELVKLAPVYYVTGNHEWRTGVFEGFEQQVKEAGVHVLRNESVKLTRNDQFMFLHGVDDPSINPERLPKDVLEENLQTVASPENYQVLLAHRPEHLLLYAKYGFDVVFSGHAHGGQIRLPWIGGLFAPGQGKFPKITEGIHKKENMNLVVSRGLGNSLFPFRIFNRPELVVIILQKETV